MKKIYSVILGAMFLGFTACENVPAPYGLNWEGEAEQEEDIVVEPAGSGTAEDPFNVIAIVNKINSEYESWPLDSKDNHTSTEKYYVKGEIIKISTKEADFPKYGNHSFTIADKGNREVTFICYQVNGPGNKKFDSLDQIKVGDEVVVYGPVCNYMGNTPETVGQGAAYVVSINGKSDGGNSGGGDNTPTNSSKENPLTVAQAKTATGMQYVKGYIVGYIDGKSIAEGSKFEQATTEATNLLIADSSTETDYNQCVPVQLPSGDIRTNLNPNKAENIGAEILIYGSIETYFGTNGIKSPTWAKIGQKEIGKDPEKEEQKDPNALTWDFTKSQGDWTIDNKKIPSELTFVWSQTTNYGMKASAFTNTSYESESWLISGALDLTGKTKMSISHTGNKFASVESMKEDIAICASTDGTNWTPLTIETYPSNANWTFVDSAVALSSFAGQKNVKIAFVYKSSTSSCGTWEVKTVTIQ